MKLKFKKLLYCCDCQAFRQFEREGKNKWCLTCRIKTTYKSFLYCVVCADKRDFELEGNIKICRGCKTRTSYQDHFSRRWNYGKSHPDSVPASVSPYSTHNSPGVEDEFEAVLGRMHKLSHRERQVVQLLWEGKSEHEAAAILGLSRSNVSTLLGRARVKLQ